ncbi:MAG: NAD(P)H-hydrate dehydratase [Croceitalea sp.]|nr:NAD(P)H-hydrate dehydratase [Croceitalea sp.]NNL08780.1 NAD(P)H-hydrate dehydratase [Croceitalea sp.]
MKIFSAEQIYEADKFTIAKQKITSDELMERAAVQIFNWMHDRLQGASVHIHLFCGIGNNGGDGIALARLLHENNYAISVHVVNYSEKRSKDFLINLDRLKERKLWPDFLDPKSEMPILGKDDIIVDAIFGIGLNRAPEAWVTKLIMHINASQAFVLAVDIPSGLYMSTIPENPEAVIKANHVLSFQTPKMVFFLPQTGVYMNQWEILDIGLDEEYLQKTKAVYNLIGLPEIRPLYVPRLKFSHKGTYGHSVIIGGSQGKIGAVNLAARACLVAGSGLVTAFVPQCGLLPLQSSAPEIMVLTDMDDKKLTSIALNIKATAYGIGMGMGTAKETRKAFKSFLENYQNPMIIDADALNILSQQPELLKLLPENSVLTPHPKELERVIGKWDDDFNKLEKVKAFTKKHHCIMVVKGAHTIIVDGNDFYVNSSGNPGMATAGSGDVLTGLLTGLLAQGYQPLNAAIFGVFLHGLAGDIAVSNKGYEALIASDLIENLGRAYMELFKGPEEVSTEAEV